MRLALAGFAAFAVALVSMAAARGELTIHKQSRIDGGSAYAVKESTGACRSHHQVIRDTRCDKCQGSLPSRAEMQSRRCRRCSAVRAA